MDALRALQSMGMGAEAGSPEGDKLLQQAEQLWSMLDDMADKDPDSYKRFIEKQRSEHEKLTAPPQPNMCLKTQFQGGGTIFVNIVEWSRMPKPQSATDNIPLFAAPLESFKEKKKETVSAITIAANPEVLEEYGNAAKNAEEKKDFISLTLDYVQHLCGKPVSRSYAILPDSTSFKGDLEQTQKFFKDSLKQALDTVKTSVTGNTPRGEPPANAGFPESMMSQLSSISVPSDKSSQPNERLEADPPITLSTSRSQKQSGKKKLIQELESVEKKLPEPKYRLEKSQSGDELVLRVELPGVAAVGECQLDISEDDAKLTVEGKYDLMVTLPARIDDAASWATFNKKLSSICLHMPLMDS
ncbi:PIH1 domain-containing protein 2-like [Littorina saxatilis]|uniref:PIH1 domain-containing protein 2 n=1 Tax=Littorina saxatilis TaxID=31220 RepID=A0AAN9BIB2_9CAEN